MVDMLQKQDLSSADFSNNNTLASGGVRVKTDAGSAVGTAIAAAMGGGSSGLPAVPTTGGPYVLGVNAGGSPAWITYASFGINFGASLPLVNSSFNEPISLGANGQINKSSSPSGTGGM